MRAPCGSVECQLAMERLERRVREAEQLLAEVHDRARTVWGAEQKYAQSEVYERVRKFLCS